MSQSPRFAMVVGEQSGDNLGVGLMLALRERFPEAEFFGVGGPKMEAQGFRSLAPMERLAVMGFVEPLGRLPELLGIMRTLERAISSAPVSAFIGIDAPDFNLRLAARLRPRGIKTVHYVSPSVWAYRAGRIHGIKKSVDLMLTLFPFETAVYEEHGVAVRCVGHPLADAIDFEDRQAEHRRQFDLAPDDPVLTLMPGSRAGEIKRLAPDFIGAALEARQHIPRLKFLIPCAGTEARLQLQNALRQANVFSASDFYLVDDSHAAISAADLVLMASGTATLEALLLRRPMIVCYRLAALTYWLASRMVKIPLVALPNLLAGRQLVPEYMQDQVQVPVLTQEIIRHFNNPEQVHSLTSVFTDIHRDLRRNASASAAAAICEHLNLDTDQADHG